jgi:hypothetical protein
MIQQPVTNSLPPTTYDQQTPVINKPMSDDLRPPNVP